LGLSRGSNRGHIARAALEAIAYQSAELMAAMQKDVAAAHRQIPLTEVRADGGAACNNMLMQFQADLLGVPVIRPTVTETTALGAAYLAGLAVGYWETQDEIRAQWRCERRFEPAMPEQRRLELMGQWQRAVERSRGWELPA
jgi:glycerol kinase